MDKDSTVRAAWITGGLALIGTIITVLVTTLNSDHGGSLPSHDSPIVHLPSVSIPSIDDTPASVFVNTTSGAVGSQVLVSGRDFQPREEIECDVGAELVATTTADSGGGFANVSIAIPDFFKPFQKPLSVTITCSGRRSVKSGETPFTISG